MVSGNSDGHVEAIYRDFYSYYNGDDPQTYGVQWSGLLWVLLFFVILSATICLVVRSYRTNDTALHPLEQFGPLTERGSGGGQAFLVILIGQILWAVYITVTHVLNGQHY